MNFEVGDVSSMSSLKDATMDKVTSGLSTGQGKGVHLSSLLMILFPHQKQAYMIHVGQNLPPKVKIELAKEMFRVLKPGGAFGLYDPGLPESNDDIGGSSDVNKQHLMYPLPFATTPSDHFLATSAEYTSAFRNAGFDVVLSEQTSPNPAATPFSTDRMRAVAANFASDGSGQLSLSHVMGTSWPSRIKNMKGALSVGALVLRTLIVRRPSGKL